MSFKNKLFQFFEALSIISGFLALLEYVAKFATWLLSVVGVTKSLNILPILIIGALPFMFYLVLNAIRRARDHLGEQKERTVIREKKETITIVPRTGKLEPTPAKPQVTKPEYDFSSFDASFKALQYATEPKTKEIMMSEFYPKLQDLCDDAVWNDETRIRVIKVLDYIPDKLSEDPNIDYYLNFIKLIIHKDKEQIKNSVKEKFLEELEKVYNDPRYETNKQILNLLQKLHEYSEDYMVRLIDEASSIVKWSDQRFQVQALDIQLWELKNRDPNAYDRVLKHLRLKMNDAEINNDEKSYERLKKLYELVKR
jgi:hypothetical protein